MNNTKVAYENKKINSLSEKQSEFQHRTLYVHEYNKYLKTHGLVPQIRGIWASVGLTTKEFGWKLHLSTIQQQALTLMEIVTPILKRYNVPFKVARNSDVLGLLNEGAYGATQVGKFATIYPASNDEALSIARDLIAVTNNLKGPMVVTDLYLGGVVYTRYGPFNPKVSRDRLGNITNLNPASDAEYKIPFIAPKEIENPFNLFERKNDLNDSTVSPIGPGYLIFQTLNARAKGSIYLAIDLRQRENIRIVVLKEGRPYCLSDIQGRSIADRLRHQFSVHQMLSGKAPIPDAGPLFEDAGNFYLPIEYIEGEDFAKHFPSPYSELSIESKKALLRELQQLVDAVGCLHSNAIIHRDLSPGNIRISNDGKIFLLDLELSCYFGDTKSIPYSAGTPGFTSPQQNAGDIPNFSDDIFALGAVMIFVITGFDPQRILFAHSHNRTEQINILSGAPQALCQIINDCLAEKSEARPTLKEISTALEKILSDLTGTKEIETEQFQFMQNDKTHEQIISALHWLCGNKSIDKNSGLWFSPVFDPSHKTTAKVPPDFRLYRSTNRGVAGVVYVLSKLYRFGFCVSSMQAKVGYAIDWLLNHEETEDDQMPGLHFGEAGVAIAISEAVKAGLIERGNWFLPYIHEALAGPIDWPDLTHGAAGQGVAALICARLLENPDLISYANRCALYLLEHQENDGSWILPKGAKGLEGSTFTGFAHGVAGIVYFLSKYANILNVTKVGRAAKLGGEWLLQQACKNKDDNALWWYVKEDSVESWKWWCHGSPGISLAFLALYELTGEDKYAETVRLSLRTHPFKVRCNNLSQCHGLSGLGEIYLEAHRVLGEDEWLIRAIDIGKTLSALARIDSDGATWIVQNPFQPTADLMIGSGGIVHFLARLNVRPNITFGMPLMV